MNERMIFFDDITMSGTPQLSSKKQQKKSLSGKKIPVKGLRNVLGEPYDFYWPIARNDNDGEVDELKTLLKESMPAIKRPSISIPWSCLHRLNKDERRIARDEARSKLNSSIPDGNILNSVVTGVNGVTRLLERNEAACVLLEANVEPMLLVKHIVTMAEANNVSIVLVDYLKSVMLETVGFASAAVALKKTVARLENHHFYNLYKKIVQLATYIGEKKPLKLDYERSVADDSCSTDKQNSTINSAVECCDKEIERSNDSFKLSSDVYMYRNSRKERMFVPEATKSDIDNRISDVDFISIGSDTDFPIDDDETVARSRKKIRYVDIRKSKEDEQDKRGEMKDDSPPNLDEYISLDPDPNPFPALPSDEESNVGNDVFHERKTKILGIREKNLSNLNSKKSFKPKKYFNDNIKYKSLKVKRIQGNVKRVKATKNPKEK